MVMLFLTLSSPNPRFIEKELVWKPYSTANTLPTTQRLEIINKMKFVAVALDEKHETLVMHMAATNIRAALNVYLS